MKFIGVYNAPAMVTMAGLVCSLTAVLLAFDGQSELAVVALIWAGIFDLFDGVVARRKVRSQLESDFGVQIDSLVDIVSFGLAPLAVAFSLSMNGMVSIFVSVIYLCATVQRLAYFNVSQIHNTESSQTPVTHYTGLPVTFAALIFGIGFSLKEVLSPSVYVWYLNALFLTTAVLFVFPLTIPKPKGTVYVLMPVLALVFSAYWLILFWS